MEITCYSCKETKPEDEFSWHCKGLKRHRECKACKRHADKVRRGTADRVPKNRCCLYCGLPIDPKRKHTAKFCPEKKGMNHCRSLYRRRVQNKFNEELPEEQRHHLRLREDVSDLLANWAPAW